jgi:hypothetical protein
MSALSLRWKLAVAGALVYLGVAWLFGGQPRAAKSAAPAERVRAPKGKDEITRTPLFYGTDACQDCHVKPPAAKWPKPLLCRCNEYTKWHEEDKHADAYEVLLNKRSQRMGKLLGISPVHEEACLNCHAVVIKNKSLEKQSELAGFKVKEGVSCVVCHGAYREWVVQHGVRLNLRKWRHLTRREKEQYGMTDLWDPVKRAALCASCHVGNKKQGKFVTHAMYAAGHPPLSSFEVATFSEAMPRHWQYLRQKKFEVQKEQGYNGKDREQSKLVLVGAAVALRESMRLLAENADACKASGPGERGLDLANFDCYACHHDLKSPRRRQARGFRGKPGRVPMSAWSAALVKLAIRHVARDSADEREQSARFARLLRQVQDGFDARPYGAPIKIAAAARALAKWADNLATKLNEKSCDAVEARKMLVALPALYKDESLDYDSARQVAWAFNVLYDESRIRRNRKAGPDPEIAGIQARLEAVLGLELPSGRNKRIETGLSKSLERINKYRPDPFQEAFQAIANRLGAKR